MNKLLITVLILLNTATAKCQLRIGESAPDIVLPGQADTTLKLSDLTGKVVLVDFWASWCGPCRAANPSVQKLYKKYGQQGFEVFAVSLDVNKALWQRAIKRDKLTYTQVIDTEGWLSKVAERYYVDAIPTNFLLDKTGKIVAINLEGKALFDTVKSMLQ